MTAKSAWLGFRFCYIPGARCLRSILARGLPRCSSPQPPRRLSSFRRGHSKPAQLAAWREVFGRTVCSLDIAPLEPATFSSGTNVYQLPGLGILFAASGAMALSHTRELIVDDDLSFMAAPSCRYTASQLDRTVELDPGDGVLMTNAEVGSMTLASTADFITFRVPRAPIAALVPDLDAAVARRIPADHAALRLLVGYLHGARHTGALTTPELQQTAVQHSMIFWRWRSGPHAMRTRPPTAAACAPLGCGRRRRTWCNRSAGMSCRRGAWRRISVFRRATSTCCSSAKARRSPSG